MADQQRVERRLIQGEAPGQLAQGQLQRAIGRREPGIDCRPVRSRRLPMRCGLRRGGRRRALVGGEGSGEKGVHLVFRHLEHAPQLDRLVAGEPGSPDHDLSPDQLVDPGQLVGEVLCFGAVAGRRSERRRAAGLPAGGDPHQRFSLMRKASRVAASGAGGRSGSR